MTEHLMKLIVPTAVREMVVDVIYDSQAQEAYRLHYGSQFGVSKPEVVWHKPDEDFATPIRATDGPKAMFLTLDVAGLNWDVVLDKISVLKRALQGAHSQAIRHYLDGSEEQVYLLHTLAGSQTQSRIPVMLGFVDDSEAFSQAITSKTAKAVVLGLTLPPYNHGQEIRLHNDFLGDAGCNRFDQYDEVVLGLFRNFGTPESTKETEIWLYGGSCQKIVTTATAHGFKTGSYPHAAGNGIVFGVWLSLGQIGSTELPGDPSVVFSVQLRDENDLPIHTVTFSSTNPSGYQETRLGHSGETWYHYVFIKKNTTSSSEMKILRTSGTGESAFYLQMIYLDVTSNPDSFPRFGWCSSSVITSRPDKSEAHLGYGHSLAVWGIPGDAPALATYDVVPYGEGAQPVMLFGRRSDNRELAINTPSWLDSEQASTTDEGWSTIYDASRIGGSFYEMVSDGTSKSLVWFFYGEKAQSLLRQPTRAFGIVRSQNAEARFGLSMNFYNVDTPTPNFGNFETVTIGIAGQFAVVDLGLINGVGMIPDNITAVATPSFYLRLTVEDVTESQKAQVDCLILLPTEEFFIAEGAGTLTNFRMDGLTHMISFDGAKFMSHGTLWHLKPWVDNQIVFLNHALTNIHIPHDELNISLIVTPRMYNLLGIPLMVWS